MNMKKLTIAAMAAMVLVTSAMAAEVNVNDYVKDGVFDTNGYYNALNGKKSKNKDSEYELLLRLFIMKESLKDAKTAEYLGGIEGTGKRAGCGGVAQRLNANYGSYENMNISQQEIKAGVVNMRQGWGHLCYNSVSQYQYDGWREYNFEKAMWGQAYAMATNEKRMTIKLKERILEGEKLDPDYVKKLPLYNQLKILRPLEAPRTDKWVRNQRIILGYAVNNIDDVEGNLFENVVDSAMINGEPWRISQFLNRPRDFIADMKKNPMVTKYYNYMATQMKDPDLLLNKIKASFESAATAQAKIEEEKRLAQAKIEEEKRLAQAKIEEEYQKNLPQLKSELLIMRKNAKSLKCLLGPVTYKNTQTAENYKNGPKEKNPEIIVNIDGDDYVGFFVGGSYGKFQSKYINPLSACYTAEEDAEYYKTSGDDRKKFERLHPRWGFVVTSEKPFSWKGGTDVIRTYALEKWSPEILYDKFMDRVEEELDK